MNLTRSLIPPIHYSIAAQPKVLLSCAVRVRVFYALHKASTVVEKQWQGHRNPDMDKGGKGPLDRPQPPLYPASPLELESLCTECANFTVDILRQKWLTP